MFKFLKKIWRKIKSFFKKEKPQRLEDCSKKEILRRVREFLKRVQTPLEELPESFIRAEFSKYREFLMEPFIIMRYTEYEKDHPIVVNVLE